MENTTIVEDQNSSFNEVNSVDIIHIDDIRKAQKIAKKEILNTPLVKLNHNAPGKEIYLKLETLQPSGSFKVRGAFNAVKNLDHSKFHSVTTASTGNFAQGLAWAARECGFKCSTYCPDTVPKTKEDNIKELRAEINKVTHAKWKRIIENGKVENQSPSEKFVHVCANYDVIAGNGVIGLEIVDQLEDFDTVICPWGGGSNTIGIASAMRQLRPEVRVYGCELDISAPLHASLKAGQASVVEDWKLSFADGINAMFLFPCMWNMVRNLIHKSVLVDEEEICHATRLLASKNKLVTEGCAAASVAAALSDDIPPGKIVCIISGGNIDMDKFVKILNYEIPCP